jgi:putative addiction module CopG family antidote
MNVDLSPENEQFIELVVAQGDYSDRREALDEAVQLLRRRVWLRHAINEGLSGEWIPAEEVHERLRQQVAEIEKHIQ